VGVLVLALASVTFCGKPPTVVLPPGPGTVSLTVSTTGSDLDGDGYTATLDDGSPQNVSPNGSVTFSNVEPGDHTLALGDVASNCSAGPTNPLSVAVQSDATASVRFDVQCGVVVAASGGTATTPDGKARVDLPSGALSDSTIISVAPAPDSLLPAGADDRLAGPAYRFLPDGTRFSKPVQITIVYDPADVPSGGSESGIRLHVVQNGQWVPVTGSTVDTSLHAVTGQTAHFSIYGALASQPGVLKAISATSGVDLDPDGYRLVVDGDAGTHLGSNDTVAVAGLSVGDHTVQLDSVASNCAVSGSNPRTVSVPAQDTATTTFTVSCSSQTGDLRVTTSTSGLDRDPDGYELSVDGEPTRHLAIDDSATLRELSSGSHSLELLDIARNCSLSGPNPRTVDVPGGGTVTAAFDVTCSADVGNLEVRAPTSGTDLDPDGYTATLDGSLSQPLATGGSITFANVDAGTHSVRLSGVAENCAVSGSNPRSVNVAFDSTSIATFDVACVPRTGSVRASNTTTGSDPDPDGYSVSVDGGAPRTMGTNGGTLFSSLSIGTHSVGLVESSVAPNCTVTSANPQSAGVTSGDTTAVDFSVSCVPNVGSITATTSARGKKRPPNFSVSLDGGPGHTIKADKGKYTFSDVPVGTHTIALAVPSQCTVTSSNPQGVDVSFDQTTTVSFKVDCP
jgi:hypothetical protein